VSRTPKPRCADGIAWLRQRLGRGALAPLTGQDLRALAAYLHLLELYVTADEPGEVSASLAIGHTLAAAQPSVWPIFKAAIPWAGEWHHEDEWWPSFEGAARSPGIVLHAHAGRLPELYR
jgi:hypothetical protein